MSEQRTDLRKVIEAKRQSAVDYRERSQYQRFEIVGDDDAKLLFGKHNGRLVSEIADSWDGRTYLRWLLNQDFPDELKEIVEGQLP